MDHYEWLSGDAARDYVRKQAEDLKRQRAAKASSGWNNFSRKGYDRHNALNNPRSKARYINDIEHWLCPDCCTWVPRSLMGRRKARWNGLDVYCRACKNNRTAATRRRNEKP